MLKSSSQRFKILFLPLLGVLLVLDQLTKAWMLRRWITLEPTLQITPFFNISFVWNRGVSFGFFKTIPWIPDVLLITCFLIIGVLMGWFIRETQRRTVVSLGIVITGALGNFIDRVRFGAVIDFLHFYWDKWHFPTFNMADTLITCGMALLLIDQYNNPSSSFLGNSLFSEKKSKKNKINDHHKGAS